MNTDLPGLHHVTAITANAQKNFDFYTQTLGLRAVKVTVNFDDPGSYHLYYGDAQGSPGTIMTFFASREAALGHPGAGQAVRTAFSVPPGGLAYWADRLGAQAHEESDRLVLRDPDGLVLELVESGRESGDFAIQGFHGATLEVADPRPTARLLTEVMGFEAEGEGRFRTPGGNQLQLVTGGRRAQMGAGAVHHLAWRTADQAAQSQWRARLLRQGERVSPVMDRNYFHSIYFREPGGVLFEIATDPPGFTVDQPLAELGTRLVLPPWLEEQRPRIQAVLPPLRLPQPT